MSENQGGGAKEANPREIAPRALAERMKSGAPTSLIDVRQGWEHEAARIEGSVLLPLPELPTKIAEIETPPPEVLVVTYCHHGVRSWQAATFLAKRGFPNVASLAGGIDAWSAEVDPKVPRY